MQHYTTRLKRIYSRKLVVENNSFDDQVLTYLNKYEGEEFISPKGIKDINVIEAARKEHVLGEAAHNENATKDDNLLGHG
jgi:hypothetical protein